ncbi:MAG: two-component regulator propeller domain-containing protein [Bacteroidota bacterium]|nr:two-component regulator propeller domain-containing protein [Bacteroidota bacterium]
MKRCPVNTINNGQGLMNNSLTDIITDAQGFTWVSTSTGMQRFNGYALQTITPVVDGEPVLINYPVCFLEGINHSLLVGYKDGVLEYNTWSNQFKKLIAADRRAGFRFALMPVKLTKEGLWCFEETRGIALYPFNGIPVREFPETKSANVQDLLRTEGYSITRKLISANDDLIFLRLTANSLFQIDVHTYKTKRINYPGAPILGIACDNSRLYVASAEGLANIRIADGSVSRKFSYKQLNDFPVTRSSIERTADHHLLVSVETHLFEFDTACTRQREIVALNHEPLLTTGYIQIVREDRLHRIWLLTHQDIKRIQNVETPFAHYIYPKEKDNFIRCIYYDKEKDLVLAGAWAGRIQCYDTSGNALWDRPVVGKGLKGLLAIEKLSDDHYLVVIEGKGLYLLRLRTKQLNRFYSGHDPRFESAILNNSYSNNLQRVDDSTIFIATRSNVFRCRVRQNQFSAVHPLLSPAEIDSQFVACFIYTRDRTLWVSTVSGVILRQDESGHLRRISIPGNYVVRCMAEDGKGNIWVGTERGLFIYDPACRLVNHVSRESGLLSDFIYDLLPAEGSENSFFASTSFGLSLISVKGKVKTYTRELGLQENEFNTQSGAISPTGKLFFGGINGVTAFHPFQLSLVSDSAFIHITRLDVNDSLYNSYGAAWTRDSIRLPYNKNHIQFDIAATGLLNPNEYLYRYRLNGFENAWQSTSQATGIRYTLQPGTYLLEVQCSAILFSNSVFQKKLMITIDPPFWKTWWFEFMIVVAAAALLFGISYFILWQRYELKSRRLAMKQQLVNERERISRELHDNIGSQLSYISNNIDWLIETPGSFSKEEETKRLSFVSDTAKTLVADLRETIWAMKKESITLEELADRLKAFLQSQCILRPLMDVSISETIENNTSFSPTEALNIFRTCQEAITNSIRHSQAGRISLTIEAGQGVAYCLTVEDNGKGFVRQMHYPDHYGLENMANRAAESGALLIVDLEPGKGTKVTIKKIKIESP